MDDWDRHIMLVALDYYIRNKQPDPIAGGVPYIDDMEWLFKSLQAKHHAK